MRRRGRKRLYNKLHTSFMLGSASMAVLVLVLFMMVVSPNLASSAQAADETFVASSSLYTSTDIPSILSVSLGDAANMTVSPTWDGSFTSGTTTIGVATNNTTGYKIFLETADGTQNLNPVSTDNIQKIAPITGTASKNNFNSNMNKWGYALLQDTPNDDTEYSAIPLVGSDAVRNTTTTATNDSYNLSFAAIINPTLPVDTYTNDVIVTVLANPLPAKPTFPNPPEVLTMADITYMQDITPEICAASELEKAYTLIDNRDNNSYTVKLLKDGNCWMTDNLVLTSQSMAAVKGNATLTKDDSDVETDWTLPETKTSTGSWTSSQTAVMSMNTNNGYGTYFTFYAAMAGTAKTTNNGVAQSSVCPKEWKLPLSGTNYDGTNGSFYYLLNAYGVVTGTVAEKLAILTGDILNFKYGGLVSSDGSLSGVGSGGYYWSSVSGSGSAAYSLGFGSSSAASSSYSSSYLGYSVRCLAKQEGE